MIESDKDSILTFRIDESKPAIYVNTKSDSKNTQTSCENIIEDEIPNERTPKKLVMTNNPFIHFTEDQETINSDRIDGNEDLLSAPKYIKNRAIYVGTPNKALIDCVKGQDENFNAY